MKLYERSQGRQKRDKKGGLKKGQKTNNLQEWKKKGRELVPLMVGSYLTHRPSNLNYICIWNYKYQVQQDFGLVPPQVQNKVTQMTG
jgi:hypothetical protein